MKFAYADPPYIGQARKHYAADPSGIAPAEVDHKALVTEMSWKYDAWALSLSSTTLQQVLDYAGDDIRIGAWVKPFASFKPGVNPAYAWEPVIFKHPRSLGRDVPTVRDWVSCNITLERGTHGAKPAEFCNWLFAFAGLGPDDEFFDLFPGSGAVTRAWEAWRTGFALRIAAGSQP